jgi:DtxR family transcriptional regulator, Mn-dependent transcriptional regulator
MSDENISSTMEDYLETIFKLNQGKGAIRVKNIARELGVKMPTVTNMLKNLSDKGFIDYEKHEYLELTDKGLEIGKEIENRHNTIRSFLTDILKLDPETADDEACRMEHGMGSETLSRLTKFIEFVQSCPRTGEGWLNYFKEYCENGLKPEKCKEHMKNFTASCENNLFNIIQ